MSRPARPRSPQRIAAALAVLLLASSALMGAARALTTSAAGATGAGSTTLASTPRVVDRTPPPEPLVTTAPTDPTVQVRARFTFTDAEAGVTFRCSLDGGAEKACRGRVRYDVDLGRHCVSVVAVDAARNRSTPARRCWTLQVGNVTVRGDATQPTAPGVTVPLALTIANPNRFAVAVTGLAVTVAANATDEVGEAIAGCPGPANLEVARTLARPVTVPARTTATLDQLGVPAGEWPAVRMPNLATDQGACRGATFHLTYVVDASRA